MLTFSKPLRDGGARDQEVAQFGQREHAEQDRRQRQPVPQIEAVEGPAQRAGLRIRADHRDHDAEAPGRDAAQRRVAGQHRHHRYAEHREGEKLRRPEIEHHRAQDRDRDREQRRAEDPAHERRHVGGAERAPRLAPLRHGIAVEHGRGRGRASRHAEQDRRDRIAGRGGGAEAEQQRERRVRIHGEGERQQHRGAGEPADARHDAEHQPHEAAEPEEHQAVRLHQQHERLARRRGHEGHFRREALHLRALPGRFVPRAIGPAAGSQIRLSGSGSPPSSASCDDLQDRRFGAERGMAARIILLRRHAAWTSALAGCP